MKLDFTTSIYSLFAIISLCLLFYFYFYFKNFCLTTSDERKQFNNILKQTKRQTTPRYYSNFDETERLIASV